MPREDLIVKKLLLFLLVLMIISTALNGLWEYGQTGIFYTINGEASFENYNLLTGRIFVDVLVTLILFIFMSIINFDWKWFFNWDKKDTFIILLFAFLASFYVEVNALYIGRWSYSSSMPLLIGTEVGFLPLLQWMVIIPISLILTRLVMKGSIKNNKRYRFY